MEYYAVPKINSVDSILHSRIHTYILCFAFNSKIVGKEIYSCYINIDIFPIQAK